MIRTTIYLAGSPVIRFESETERDVIERLSEYLDELNPQSVTEIRTESL